jgi:hypothetical protein
VPVSRSMNFGNGVSLMARRCAAMCFLMAGCADRSPGLGSYRRARGFICIVPGDAARIARKTDKIMRLEPGRVHRQIMAAAASAMHKK